MQVIEQSHVVTKVTPKRATWKFWKLVSEQGRQRWMFDDIAYKNNFKDYAALQQDFEFDKSGNPNSQDLPLRQQKKKILKDESSSINDSPLNYPNSLSFKASEAANKCIEALSNLQMKEGHWAGDYGGPLFLLPALIICSRVTKSPFDAYKTVLMKQYMLNHQNADGGWGLHIEGESNMFGTVMQYCALRILGAERDDSAILKARRWIISNGGATSIPPWGKFFLAILGVYDWKGCDSLLPELWLLPRWFPIHPGKYWCHARMVYLPMSYCFSKRVIGEIDSTISALREELYEEAYDSINWIQARNQVCKLDSYNETSGLTKWLFTFLNGYELFPSASLRNKATQFALDYINAEDKQTDYVDIGPVNQIINSICVWHAYGADSEQFKKHRDRWDDYLWLAEDGMKMNGYNGSQLWDTAFMAQAIAENTASKQSSKTLLKAYDYILRTEITEEVDEREKFFRHPSKGAWPFSTKDHGWPITDCTSEALKAIFAIHKLDGVVPERINEDNIFDAIELILSWQNNDGGWATYENKRAGSWLEHLNPSGIFDEIMVDYSWVECTSACITALCEFQKNYPGYKSKQISKAIDRGVEFIKKEQKVDGSWKGSWGICFTYGTWFAIEALTQTNINDENKEAIKKACTFLKSKQKEDGSWGESYRSCLEESYIEHAEGQVVQTAWALLSMMAADCPDKQTIRAGIKFLIKSQQENGEWPQQSISGVFNKTCMISYSSYRNIFPLWAIGRYVNEYCRKLSYQSHTI